MKKVLKSVLLLALLLCYQSCVDCKDSYEPQAPTETPTEEKVIVTTGAATNITNATATISGSVEIPNTVKSVINVGFVYSATVTNPSINTGILRLSNQSPDSEFNVVLSGLKCDITYYYRTYVYIDGKGYYGEVKTFTTEKVIVTTGTATNITNSTAIINGSISNFIPDGISPVEIGVRFGKDPSELHSEISIESNTSGEFSVSLTGLESGTTYYYCSCIRISEIYYKGEVLSFTTKDEITSGQEVDLGLSVKWAGWNVGATSPEQYGGYYAWGETEEKSDYSNQTYKYYNDGIGYVNIGENISGTQYDVATVKWGNGWRMPTEAELEELNSKCRFEGYTYNGVIGTKVTGPNGNAIFLPYAGYRVRTSLYTDEGYYWSGSNREGAWYLRVSGFGRGTMFNCYADGTSAGSYGYTVRPVR